MRPFRATLALLACATAFDAAALSCGDTVSGHVVLTADLHCTTGWTALYVDSAGTTIDLNGHTLSGDVALEGIGLLDAHGTTIKGPGTIKGFWVGVNGTRSDGVRVEGVEFADVDAGVILTNSDFAMIERNRFTALRSHAVNLSDYPGSPGGAAGGHRIVDNLVQDAVFGFQLCGAATGNSLVSGNTLEKIRDYGIHLEDGSANNEISGNSLFEVGNIGIRIAASSGTLLEGNYLKHGRVGIALFPDQVGLCDTGGTAEEVRDTVVRGHSVFEHETAVVAGLGLGKAATVYKNRINRNKFYYDDTGVLFLEDAHHNDATGNAYAGTTDPVLDFGYGNAW